MEQELELELAVNWLSKQNLEALVKKRKCTSLFLSLAKGLTGGGLLGLGGIPAILNNQGRNTDEIEKKF